MKNYAQKCDHTYWRAASILMLLAVMLVGCKADISVQDEPVDPVVQEFPLVFIERPLVNIDDNGDEQALQTELFEPARFNGGAKLILKKNAFAQSEETDLLAGMFACCPTLTRKSNRPGAFTNTT